jgi:phage terminase small subunit
LAKKTDTNKRGLTVIDGGRPDEGSPGTVERRGGDAKDSKLTAKQAKFVQGILRGLSQSDAYRAAYDCANMAANSIWREASVLLTNPKVSQRLKALQARQDDAALLSGLATRQHIQRTLYGLTTDGENDAAKLRACELLGKLSDVAAFTERIAVENDQRTPEEITVELEKKLRAAFEGVA